MLCCGIVRTQLNSPNQAVDNATEVPATADEPAEPAAETAEATQTADEPATTPAAGDEVAEKEGDTTAEVRPC